MLGNVEDVMFFCFRFLFQDTEALSAAKCSKMKAPQRFYISWIPRTSRHDARISGHEKIFTKIPLHVCTPPPPLLQFRFLENEHTMLSTILDATDRALILWLYECHEI